MLGGGRLLPSLVVDGCLMDLLSSERESLGVDVLADSWTVRLGQTRSSLR